MNALNSQTDTYLIIIILLLLYLVISCDLVEVLRLLRCVLLRRPCELVNTRGSEVFAVCNKVQLNVHRRLVMDRCFQLPRIGILGDLRLVVVVPLIVVSSNKPSCLHLLW